jgi:phosphoglycerate dehydrogenase-like enzyme
MDNVILTPHVSGLYDEYVSRALPILEENLRCFLAGEPGAMINRVKRHG